MKISSIQYFCQITIQLLVSVVQGGRGSALSEIRSRGYWVVDAYS